MNTRESGQRGEELAWQYLKRRGYALLERNFRIQRYEIDLILEKDGVLVFVEVKARGAGSLISGREAVNSVKQSHIMRAAQGYLQRHAAFDRPVRFDVAEVDLSSGGVIYIEGAFPR